jgi:hypothetical protein
MHAAFDDHRGRDRELANHDLKFVATDGECAPRTVAYLLDGTDANWKEIKEAVARYALDNREHLHEQFGLMDDDIEDMHGDGAWQREIFLKVASEAFGIHLRVYGYLPAGKVAAYEPSYIHYQGEIFFWNSHFSPIVPQRFVHVDSSLSFCYQV